MSNTTLRVVLVPCRMYGLQSERWSLEYTLKPTAQTVTPWTSILVTKVLVSVVFSLKFQRRLKAPRSESNLSPSSISSSSRRRQSVARQVSRLGRFHSCWRWNCLGAWMRLVCFLSPPLRSFVAELNGATQASLLSVPFCASPILLPSGCLPVNIPVCSLIHRFCIRFFVPSRILSLSACSRRCLHFLHSRPFVRLCNCFLDMCAIV